MKTQRIRIIIILLCGALCTSSSGYAGETVITLSIGEWPPWTSKQLPGYGKHAQIVSMAYAKKGIKVEYKFFPWARAYMMAEVGEADGTFPWVKKPERLNTFYYSDALDDTNDGYVFFYLKDNPFDWQEFTDLKGLSIGGQQDYYYGEGFHKALKDGVFRLSFAAQDHLLFRMLLAHRFPVLIMEKSAGEGLIKKHLTPEEAQRITIHPKIVEKLTGHILMRKTNPKSLHLINLFNQGLHEMHEDGSFDAIFNK